MNLRKMYRPRVVALVTAGALAGALTPFAVSSAMSSSPRAAAGAKVIADSYVRPGTPARDRGTRDFFRASRGYTSYLKIRVTDTPAGPIRLHLWSRVETKATLTAYAVAPRSWSEKKLAASNAPRLGAALGTARGLKDEGWTSVDVSRLISGPGTYTVALKASGGARAKFSSRRTGRFPRLTYATTTSTGTPTSRPTGTPSATGTPAGTPSPTPTPTASTASRTPSPTAPVSPKPEGAAVTVAVVGDIVKDENNARGTAALIREMNPKYLLTVGDNAYDAGSASDFARYNRVYGEFKAKTRPVPGNHEYRTSGAKGYFDYFADETGRKPYYAFDAGAWRIYALNSEIDQKKGSPQEKWLRADLAANPGKRYLATMHKPRYTCSTRHNPYTQSNPLWEALLDAGGDIVLAGHNHAYERFAPMDNTWQAKADGMRAWVVGTGGASIYGLEPTCSNREYRQDTDKGVLKLVLAADSYSWEFLAVGGKVMDKGTQAL